MVDPDIYGIDLAIFNGGIFGFIDSISCPNGHSVMIPSGHGPRPSCDPSCSGHYPMGPIESNESGLDETGVEKRTRRSIESNHQRAEKLNPTKHISRSIGGVRLVQGRWIEWEEL